MKASFAVVLAAAVAGANAQSACLSTALAIPACGQSVLLSLASSYGCGMTDFACQCTHQSAIQAVATQPVLSACSDVNTALAVQSSALALCSCVSANAGSGGSSAPASTAAKTTAAGSSAAAGGSSAAATSAAAMQTSAAGGSAPSVAFTGAAATAGSLAPVGGVLGLLAGLVAYL